MPRDDRHQDQGVIFVRKMFIAIAAVLVVVGALLVVIANEFRS